jgi:hypothetical protein
MVCWPNWFVMLRKEGSTSERVMAKNAVCWTLVTGTQRLEAKDRKDWKGLLAKSLGVDEAEHVRLMNTRQVYECVKHFPVTSVKLLTDGTCKLCAMAQHCPGGVRTTTTVDLTRQLQSAPVLRATNARSVRNNEAAPRAVLETCATLLFENRNLLQKSEGGEREIKRLKARATFIYTHTHSLSPPLSLYLPVLLTLPI